MLQQTQVDRVIPKYLAFLDRFPTVVSCADSSVGEVLKLWAGLGYNRRAKNLHLCAVQIVDRHDGLIPTRLDDLLQLAGVGPYTARAVSAFAFEHDVAVVDTNVGRILARRLGHSLSAREVQAAADEVTPEGEGWAWNQSMLDLGALVCTKRNPKCETCPASTGCAWRGVGVDPAVGSAGVSGKQSTFEGSDRQGRGRFVQALRLGPVDMDEIAAVMGWPTDPERARRVAFDLVEEGLAEVVAPDGDPTKEVSFVLPS